jgi:hypothetical protein
VCVCVCVYVYMCSSLQPYANDESPSANNTAVLFIGELLGKIWRVELDFSSLNGKKISLSGYVSRFRYLSIAGQ